MNAPVPYIILIAFLALVTVAAIVVIIIRAPSTADQLTLIGAIIAFMSPLITSIVALFRAEKANGIAKQTKEIVDNHVEPKGPAV